MLQGFRHPYSQSETGLNQRLGSTSVGHRFSGPPNITMLLNTHWFDWLKA